MTTRLLVATTASFQDRSSPRAGGGGPMRLLATTSVRVQDPPSPDVGGGRGHVRTEVEMWALPRASFQASFGDHFQDVSGANVFSISDICPVPTQTCACARHACKCGPGFSVGGPASVASAMAIRTGRSPTNPDVTDLQGEPQSLSLFDVAKAAPDKMPTLGIAAAAPPKMPPAASSRKRASTPSASSTSSGRPQVKARRRSSLWVRCGRPTPCRPRVVRAEARRGIARCSRGS